MKVDFAIEEVMAMTQMVIDGLLEEKFGRKDAATLRRWRKDVVATTSEELRLLTEKVNRDIQRTHDRSLRSGISKPDWV